MPMVSYMGVTYIDRQTKAVFNGSDLGKEFSAAAIRLLPETQPQMINRCSFGGFPLSEKRNSYYTKPETLSLGKHVIILPQEIRCPMICSL